MRGGLTICEDIWSEEFAGVGYGQDPVRDLAGRCDLIVNSSASPYNVGKPLLRHRVVATLAKTAGVPVAYCNQVGGHDELLFDGLPHRIHMKGRGKIVIGGLARGIRARTEDL